MKSYRKELWFNIPSRRGFVNITSQVEEALQESEIKEGMVLVNHNHITASTTVGQVGFATLDSAYISPSSPPLLLPFLCFPQQLINLFRAFEPGDSKRIILAFDLGQQTIGVLQTDFGDPFRPVRQDAFRHRFNVGIPTHQNLWPL